MDDNCLTLLLTRPREDSEPLAELLRQDGFAVEIDPLLKIVPIENASLDLEGAQAILVTSANGVRALARTVAGKRDTPVYAVGDGSAAEARNSGFTDVHSAAGDVHALAALVTERLKPETGALVHVAGSDRAGDLAGMLEKSGFTCRRAVLYRAEKATRLAPATVRALLDGRIGGVLFFSPRTAEAFAALARKARAVGRLAAVDVYCLSQAVADKISDIPWRAVHVAPRPDQDSLIEVVMAARKTETPTDHAPAQEAEPAGPPEEKASKEETSEEIAAEPETPKPETPKPETVKVGKASSGLPVFVWALIFTAVLIVGGYFTQDRWLPEAEKAFGVDRTADAPPSNGDEGPLKVADVPPPAELADLLAEKARLEASLSTLVDRVAELERSLDDVRRMAMAVSPPDREAGGAELRELVERINRLEREGEVADTTEFETLKDRLARLERENTPINQAVADLARRLAELETLPEAEEQVQPGAVPGLVLAVGQLRDALRTAKPFARELETVTGLAASAGTDSAEAAEAAAILAPMAEKGVPTIGILRNQLEALAGPMIRAAVTPAGGGWLERTAQQLASVITIRRTEDNLRGDSIDALVAQIGAALTEGDLAAAVATAETIEGPPAEMIAPWLVDAGRRLAAEQAVAKLHVFAISLVASGGGRG